MRLATIFVCVTVLLQANASSAFQSAARPASQVICGGSASHRIPPLSLSSNDSDGNAEDSNRRLLFLAGGIASASLLSPHNALAASSGLYTPAPGSMEGKTVVITGGNTGLGLESGKRLAAAGAIVVLTTRTAAKGEKAIEDVQQYLSERGVTNNQVSALTLDLCDFRSIKAFPATLEAALNKKPIDVLMNNAGVMALQSRELTKDGYEKTFQTNHLGHFVLTAKLVPQLSASARIINVSSEAWQFASKGLELDNLNAEREFGPWSSYGTSKLANILFTKELQERALASNKSWTVTALHPGAVATDLGRYLVGEEKWNDMKQNGMSLTDKLLFVPLSKFTKTVEDGASTQIFLAADASAEAKNAAGKYFIDMKAKELKSPAIDMDKAKALWSISEELGGTKFEF